MLGTVLLIVLILALLGSLPAWPHSQGWGYGPSGGLGLVVLILVILLGPVLSQQIANQASGIFDAFPIMTR